MKTQLIITLLLAAIPLSKGYYSIDWKRCDLTNGDGVSNCFITGSCIGKNSDNLVQMIQFASIDDSKPKTFGLMNRAYSTRKQLMVVQVIGVNSLDKSKKPELVVYHDTKKLFGCYLEEGKIKLSGDNDFIKNHQIKLYDVSHWNEGHVVCAVLISKTDEMLKTLDSLSRKFTKIALYESKDQDPPKMEAVNDNVGLNILMSATPTCDPDDLMENIEVPGMHVHPIPDKGGEYVNCKGLTSFTYKLYAQKTGAAASAIDDIICDKTNNIWTMMTSSVPESIDPEKVTFYCGVSMDKMCEEPACSGENCPAFMKGTDTDAAKLSCPDSKWFINGEYVAGSQPFCKDAETKMNEAAFYIKYPSGHEGLLPENSTCFEKYDCNKKSRVDFSNCISEECGILNKHSDNVTCASGGLVHVLIRSTNTIMNATKYTCDTSDGLWKDKAKKVIPDGSYVYCDGKLHVAEADLGDAGALHTIIGVGVGSLLLITAGIGFGVCASRRLTRMRKVSKPKNWKSLDDKSRIKISQDNFNKIMKGGYTAVQLGEGFNFIETLIKNAEHHPEVWEPAIDFLSRFQATVMRFEPLLFARFTSYCYAKAEQIAQAHGWRTPHPITRNNHEGYIRAIGINFLGRALLSPDNRRAKLLLGEAFFNLRLNGDEQYPLSGLIWGLVTQSHLDNFLSTAGTNERYDFKNFEDCLEKVRLLYTEFPEMDYIPQHGSVADQARAAILQSRNFNRLFDSSSFYFGKKAEQYFKANNNKIYGSADRCLIEAHKLSKDKKEKMKKLEKSKKAEDCKNGAKKPASEKSERSEKSEKSKNENGEEIDKLSKLRKYIPEPEFTRVMTETFQKMICNGKSIDAKKLQMRLQLESPEFNQRISEFKMEQRQFEEAVTTDKESLISWFNQKIVEQEAEAGKKIPQECSEVGTTTVNSTKSVQETKSGGATSAVNSGTEKTSEKKPYVPEDWKIRHETGVPQRLLEICDNIKLENIFPKEFDRTKVEAWKPTRQKECLASPDQQAKCIKLLDQIFSENYRIGKRIHFDQDDMLDVLHNVRDLVSTEPMLIEDVPSDTYILGDMHGSIYDLYRYMKGITEKNAKGKKIYEYGRYLFLGDYVDRGHNSLELIMTLFILKILYPDRFFLLRGNHEFYSSNTTYGFYMELVRRYGDKAGEQLHKQFNAVFGYLSTSAIVGGSIFCAHAGISLEMFSRSELINIPKPLHRSFEDKVIHDLVWSDPMDGLEGTMFNEVRNTSIHYGEDTLRWALSNIGCVLMIRGHSVMDEGFQTVWNGLLTTVFSATGSGGYENDGSVIHVGENNQITIMRLKLFMEYRNYIYKYINLELEETGEKDELTVCEKRKGKIAVFNETKTK